jgi:NADH:ubiquinone oxidoreductase subunit 5 (subunit L)/multisubunit Na+/H+ antiporter MnhA subunit
VAVLAIAGLCSGLLWVPFLHYGEAGAPFFKWLKPEAMSALGPAAFDPGAGSDTMTTTGADSAWARFVSNINTHALGWAGVSALIAMVGAIIAWYTFRRGPRLPVSTDGHAAPLAPVQGASAAWTWWLDRLYDVVIVKPLILLGHALALVIDYPLVAGIGRGCGAVLDFFAGGFAGFQRSRLRVSLLLSALGLVAVLAMVVIELAKVPMPAPAVPAEATP